MNLLASNMRRWSLALRDNNRMKENNKMGNQKPVFQVGNKHGASCGEPPHIDGNQKGCYHGYFENEHGEQAVFAYDYEAKNGTLWMGDNGWGNPVPVVAGEAKELLLNEAEALWLKACWLAATAFLDNSAG